MVNKALFCVMVALLAATGLRAQGCGPVNAPWWADFSTDSSFGCWSAYGDAVWTRNTSGSNHRLRAEFNSASVGNSGWLLSQPIVLPADSTGLKFFWSQNRGNNTSGIDSMNMTLRVLVTDSLGTAPFDTLYTGSAYQPNGSFQQRTVSLAPYAGQTVRVAFAVERSASAPNRYMLVSDVMARSDRMPVLNNLTTPATVVETGQVLTCHIRLAEGDTVGLHYAWSSLVGGVFTPRGRGDTATLVYGAGFSGEYDTVTVTATNPYGSSTKSRAVRVIDCTPATTLPWYEPFANGLHCWLRPWARQYASEWFVNSGSLRSVCNSDTLDSWVVSKAVVVPPAVGDSVRLSWREWKLYDDWPGFAYSYQVLATADSDYTDSTQYTTLYSGGGLTTLPVLRSVSLASFAGQTIHIAFRNQSGNTHGTVTGSAYYNTLCIDSIVVDGHADTLPAAPDTVWRTVAAASADEGLGMVLGAGIYPDSSLASLTAIPFGPEVTGSQVEFDHWNDGDTSNPRQVFVVSDTSFTAYFSVVDTLPVPPDTVWRTVAAASADEGLGTVVGGGLVPDSSVVSLVAVPHTHDAQVVFDRWNDGDTSNPRQVFVVSDTAFTAYFSVMEDSVGIADSPFPASALRLYPNPTSGKVVVACAETVATVTLTDLAGRGYTVHFTPCGEGKYELDLAFLPQGNYLLAVVTAEGKRHSVRLTRQ